MTFSAAMFSAVSTASHTMGAWQNTIMLSFWATWLFASCLASGRLRADMSEGNNVIFSLQTKRAIYLTKTPFQLNCELHNIWNPLYVESDSSCDRSGIGIFSHCKTLHFCFAVKGKFYGHFWQHFFMWQLKKVSVTSCYLPKKVNFRPWVLRAHHIIFPCVISPANVCIGKYVTFNSHMNESLCNKCLVLFSMGQDNWARRTTSLLNWDQAC